MQLVATIALQVGGKRSRIFESIWLATDAPPCFMTFPSKNYIFAAHFAQHFIQSPWLDGVIHLHQPNPGFYPAYSLLRIPGDCIASSFFVPSIPCSIWWLHFAPLLSLDNRGIELLFVYLESNYQFHPWTWLCFEFHTGGTWYHTYHYEMWQTTPWSIPYKSNKWI